VEEKSPPEEPLKYEEEYDTVDKPNWRKKEGSESLEQQPKASPTPVIS
jgi:hypothetical protein